ncbi:hypothetical protein AB1E18_016101 [Capra hircus]
MKTFLSGPQAVEASSSSGPASWRLACFVCWACHRLPHLHRETICSGTRKFARGRERVASKRARGSGSGAGDHGAAGASSAGVKAALPLPPRSPRCPRSFC